ncbi:MAG: hypothetical protein MZW92_37500 [Comamonadaceae bacterium]|nr:hypothetical protein [Comamonadaceae bacterium]
MTIQKGGVDISLPLPFLSVNVEVRRLLGDDQTAVLGEVWFASSPNAACHVKGREVYLAAASPLSATP